MSRLRKVTVYLTDADDSTLKVAATVSRGYPGTYYDPPEPPEVEIVDDVWTDGPNAGKPSSNDFWTDERVDQLYELATTAAQDQFEGEREDALERAAEERREIRE